MADNNVKLNTAILVNYLCECNNRYFTMFKNESEKAKLREEFLNNFKQIIQAVKENKVDLTYMRHCVLQQTWNFELLGHLNNAGLIDLGAYLAMKDSNQNTALELAQDFQYYIVSDKHNLKTLLEGISAYCKDEQTLDGPLMSTFTQFYYQKLSNLDSTNTDDSFPQLLSDFRKEVGIFYTQTKILTLAFMENGSRILPTLSDVKSYKSTSDSKGLACFMEAVIAYADVDDVSSYLADFILNCPSESEINWKNVSLLVCLIIQKNGYPKIRAVIQEFVEECLEESDPWLLTITLIFGRIITLNDSGLKLTYLSWFSSTFSSESQRPLNTEKRAKFFLSCLADRLDYEQAGYLKAYLQKAPSVPATCQPELTEFLKLVKSRLESLNESTEVGFFGAESARNDVQILVDLFVKSNSKIPQSFLGAVTLRKKYFDREFVPKLLSECRGKLTSHHAVICQLAQLGKITGMAFRTHCQMNEITPQAHHVRGIESNSRPLYRRGRHPTAVKVFTIIDESVHLLVFGVPAIHLENELHAIAREYGDVEIAKVESYPDLEPFTQLFHLKFERIAAARTAKRRLDGLEFYGGLLHVCYAPELEHLDETRSKIIQRSKLVQSQMTGKKSKQLRSFQDKSEK